MTRKMGKLLRLTGTLIILLLLLQCTPKYSKSKPTENTKPEYYGKDDQYDDENNDNEDEKEMWEKVVKLHIDKADEKKTELSVKRIHLKKAINILNDRNDPEQVKTVTEKLADICIKIGEKQLTMGGLDIEVIAALEFRQAADLLESIDGSKDKIKELRVQADKLEK